MTKTQLENYIHLRGEIEDLKRERVRLERRLAEKVTDTVQGSTVEFPYISHPITISGADEEARRKLQQKIVEISAAEERLAKEEAEIRQWIESIPESRIRRLMRYKYIDGCTWIRIAIMLKYDSADAARMAHSRFIEKNL